MQRCSLDKAFKLAAVRRVLKKGFFVKGSVFVDSHHLIEKS